VKIDAQEAQKCGFYRKFEVLIIRIKIQKMKNIKKYMLIFFLGAMAVSSILMTVATATSGAEVANLQKEQARLADQKRYLESTLVKTLSMDQLDEKSGSLGYVKPANLVYVALPESVAKLP